MTEKPETFFDQGQTSSPLQAEVVFETETQTSETAAVNEEKPVVSETTTQTKEEVKPEPEKKGILANFDSATQKKEEVKTEAKAETKEEFKLPAHVQARLDRLEQLEKNEDLKLIAGDKDLSEIDLDKLIKTAIPKDYSGTSNEELLRAELREKYPTASDDEIEAGLAGQLAKFESLSEAEQKLERGAMIAKLTKAQPESELIKTLKGLKEKQSSTQNPQELIQQEVDKSFKDIHSYFSETSATLIGQSYKGYVVTKEDAEAIPKALEDTVKAYDQDKTFMTYFKATTYDAYGDAREKMGYEKAMKEKANPSQGNSDQVIMTTDSEGLKGAKKEDFFNQANS